MDKLHEAIGLGLILGIVHGTLQPAWSVPVVPNFTQGQTTQHTESTTTMTESMKITEYSTGWNYVVTGTNITFNGSPVPPTSNNNTSLNLNSRPNFQLDVPGAPFQFSESYSGPGLIKYTEVERTTVTDSVITSTSVFTQ